MYIVYCIVQWQSKTLLVQLLENLAFGQLCMLCKAMLKPSHPNATLLRNAKTKLRVSEWTLRPWSGLVTPQHHGCKGARKLLRIRAQHDVYCDIFMLARMKGSSVRSEKIPRIETESRRMNLKSLILTLLFLHSKVDIRAEGLSLCCDLRKWLQVVQPTSARRSLPCIAFIYLPWIWISKAMVCQ